MKDSPKPSSTKPRIAEKPKLVSTTPTKQEKDEQIQSLLSDLEESVKAEDMLDDKQRFADLFRKSMELLGVKDIEIAYDLHLNQQTIGGWRRNRSIPPRLTREAVYNWLAKRAKQILTGQTKKSR